MIEAERGGIGPWLFGRPWRLLAGVLIGCAVAVKWSGAYSVLGVVLLVVGWEVVGRRIDVSGVPRSWSSAFGAAFRAEGLRTVVLLGFVPVFVYVLTYAGVAEGSLLAAPWREGSWLYDVAHHQVAMARFHAGLDGHHPYESPSWSWFLLKRPVAFWFEDGSAYTQILSMGNPLAWWPALAAIGWLSIRWARGHRDLPTAVILVGLYRPISRGWYWASPVARSSCGTCCRHSLPVHGGRDGGGHVAGLGARALAVVVGCGAGRLPVLLAHCRGLADGAGRLAAPDVVHRLRATRSADPGASPTTRSTPVPHRMGGAGSRDRWRGRSDASGLAGQPRRLASEELFEELWRNSLRSMLPMCVKYSSWSL